MSTIDRDVADQYQKRLDGLDLGDEGRVRMLVETPVPHQHVDREEVELVPGRGCAGDHDRKSFYKGKFVPGREVSAMAGEVLDVLGVDPIVVGDNLITEGLDLAALDPGDRLQVGTAVIERSRVPHRPCTVFRDRTSPEAFAALDGPRHRGALFVVRRAGTVEVGGQIRRV
jgi:hypothetical protein